MSQEDNADKKPSTENFVDIFRTFGQAIRGMFKDPELKENAKELTDAAAESVKTFGSRFKDEDVKDKFRDVGKAAEDFGKSVAGRLKKKKGKKF